MKNYIRLQGALAIAMLLVTISTKGASAAPQKIHLKGDVSDRNCTEFTLKYQGLLSEVNSSRDIRIKCKKGARFDTTLTLPAAGYYGIFQNYSTFENLLYLTPGDNLEVHFDAKNGVKTAYKGKGAEANQYLAGFSIYFYGNSGGSFLKGGLNDKGGDLELTKQVVDSLALVQLKKLEGISGLSADFRKMERARIFAHLANTYSGYFFHQKGLDMDNVAAGKKKFFSKIRPYIEHISKEFMSDSCIDQPDVREVMKRCVVKDSILAVSPSSNSNVYEYLTLLSLKNAIEEECSTEIVAKATSTLGTFKNKNLADNLRESIRSVERLLKGNIAYDIMLETPDGKVAKLSDYKGKTIYVDFWATWCGPCIGETPYFSKLNEKFNRPDLVFISVSLDKKKNDWKNFIKEEKSSAVQYIAADLKKLANDWQIKGIPRFLIIDKNFRIVNANAPRPSTGEKIEKELNETL
jgi:Thiol-disulfide isomerase and thioredoxins